MKKSVTQAMILAAGLGTRMRPLTEHCPKPFIEVAGRSMIDRAMDRLKDAGIEHVVVNISHLAEVAKERLAQRTDMGITLSHEVVPLETGGGVAHALRYFNESAPFYVINGDIIWVDGQDGTALQQLSDVWNDDMDALLLLVPHAQTVGYSGPGDFFLHGDVPQRRAVAETAPYVFTGIQILHPRLFKECPTGAFSLNLLYDFAAKGMSSRLRACVFKGIWLHAGDLDSKKEAERFIANTGLQT